MKLNRKRIIIYVLGSIFFGFLALTILVSFFPVSLLDREFTEELQEHQNPILDGLMKVISWPGYTPQSIIMALSASITFLIFKHKREALFTAMTLFSGLISSSLKILINRPRPTEDIVRIIEKAKYQSFPSGHVLFYVMFFGFLIILMYHLTKINRSLRIAVMTVSAALIFTVPFSRIYLGAHWFTDVLGSALLGILGLYVLGYYYLKKA